MKTKNQLLLFVAKTNSYKFLLLILLTLVNISCSSVSDEELNMDGDWLVVGIYNSNVLEDDFYLAKNDSDKFFNSKFIKISKDTVYTYDRNFKNILNKKTYEGFKIEKDSLIKSSLGLINYYKKEIEKAKADNNSEDLIELENDLLETEKNVHTIGYIHFKSDSLVTVIRKFADNSIDAIHFIKINDKSNWDYNTNKFISETNRKECVLADKISNNNQKKYVNNLLNNINSANKSVDKYIIDQNKKNEDKILAEWEKSDKNGYYVYKNQEFEMKIQINSTNWFGTIMIKSGFGDEYDMTKAIKNYGILKKYELFNNAGIKIGYIDKDGIHTSILNKKINLRKE